MLYEVITQDFFNNSDVAKQMISDASKRTGIDFETLLFTENDKFVITSYSIHYTKLYEYDDAKKRFTIADAKGYKPAASNYYLGEIAYYTQQYEDAIFYYKKSAGLYDKAEYIDVLLLHTAISLERTGNKEQAKLFYQNIIDVITSYSIHYTKLYETI